MIRAHQVRVKLGSSAPQKGDERCPRSSRSWEHAVKRCSHSIMPPHGASQGGAMEAARKAKAARWVIRESSGPQGARVVCRLQTLVVTHLPHGDKARSTAALAASRRAELPG